MLSQMADFSAMRVVSLGSRGLDSEGKGLPQSPAGVSDCDGSGSKAKAISDLRFPSYGVVFFNEENEG